VKKDLKIALIIGITTSFVLGIGYLGYKYYLKRKKQKNDEINVPADKKE